jgi:hypothetical protein
MKMQENSKIKRTSISAAHAPGNCKKTDQEATVSLQNENYKKWRSLASTRHVGSKPCKTLKETTTLVPGRDRGEYLKTNTGQLQKAEIEKQKHNISKSYASKRRLLRILAL